MIVMIGHNLKKKDKTANSDMRLAKQAYHQNSFSQCTFSAYDEDAGYLLELLGWKNLLRQHNIEKS